MCMKVEAGAQSANYNSVFTQLSDTDKKIAFFIKTSKIIVFLGLLLSIIFSPIAFQLIGLGYLSAYSLALVSTNSFLAGIALSVNLVFAIRAYHKKNEIMSILQTSTERIEEMPLGLTNSGNNCWANSMIQFMKNIPKIKNSISNLGFFSRLRGIKSLLSTYQNEEKNSHVRISSVDSQNLRRLISSISPDIISPDVSRQEDAHEAFAIISDLLPKSIMKKSYTYSMENLSKPKPGSGPNRKELYIRDEKTFVKSQNEELSFIPLSIFPSRFFTPCLSDLIDFSFNSTDLGDNHAELEGEDGKLHSYDLKSENWCYISAPEDIFFSLNRFVAKTHVDPTSGERKFHSEKICSKVNVPLVLQLKKEKHIIESDAGYELDSFIIHRGDSVERGHYICCVKKNNHWYECNDSDVRLLSENEATELASSSYLVHYKKI